MFLNVWTLLKKSRYLIILLQIFFLQSCSSVPAKEEVSIEKSAPKPVRVEEKKEIQPPPPSLEDLSIVKDLEDGRPYQISKLCGEQPVFIEISASWCDACKEMYPVTEKLKNMFKGKVCFLRIMVDEKPFEGETEIKIVYPVSSPEVLGFARSDALPRVVVLNGGDKEPYADLSGKDPFLYYYGILSEL